MFPANRASAGHLLAPLRPGSACQVMLPWPSDPHRSLLDISSYAEVILPKWDVIRHAYPARTQHGLRAEVLPNLYGQHHNMSSIHGLSFQKVRKSQGGWNVSCQLGRPSESVLPAARSTPTPTSGRTRGSIILVLHTSSPILDGAQPHQLFRVTQLTPFRDFGQFVMHCHSRCQRTGLELHIRISKTVPASLR